LRMHTLFHRPISAPGGNKRVIFASLKAACIDMPACDDKIDFVKSPL
jgi:hypothetical protein